MSTNQPQDIHEQGTGENDDNGPTNDNNGVLSTNTYQPVVVRGRGKPKANSLEKFADDSVKNRPPHRESRRTRSKALSFWLHDRYEEQQELPQLQAIQERKDISSQPLDPFGAALKYIVTNASLSRDQLDELVRSVMIQVENKHDTELKASGMVEFESEFYKESTIKPGERMFAEKR